ncbi:MAG TPA: outer membrane protein assembly factor, partial [Epsilonproteobacteria bacterium]|nr:outer membrane protein assembly factor [Campylobacterota bacterium]
MVLLNVFRLLLLTTLLLAGKEVNLECRSITFEGNTVVETASLEEAAGVQRPGKLTFWKDQTPRIKCALIPTIPEALRSLYHSEGFYDATFNIAEDDRSVKITVKEGKPVRVSEVEIESDYNISAFIPFVTKQRFKTATFIQSKSDVIKALLDEGYCSYDLDTKAYIDVEKY